MQISRRRVIQWTILLGLLLGGCKASSPYMIKTPAPSHVKAPADASLVTFLRPSSLGPGNIIILDDQGKFLGDSLPSSYFTVKLPPGKRVFVAWGDNTAGIMADLAAGKRYYVEVHTEFNMGSTKVSMMALCPRSSHWNELSDWVLGSQYFEVDQAKGQAYLDGQKGAVESKILVGQAIAKEHEEEGKEFAVFPDDGQ